MSTTIEALNRVGERLARIEERQEGHDKKLDAVSEKLDRVTDRVANVEANSKLHGALAGGVISVGIAYISAKLKGGA